MKLIIEANPDIMIPLSSALEINLTKAGFNVIHTPIQNEDKTQKAQIDLESQLSKARKWAVAGIIFGTVAFLLNVAMLIHSLGFI